MKTNLRLSNKTCITYLILKFCLIGLCYSQVKESKSQSFFKVEAKGKKVDKLSAIEVRRELDKAEGLLSVGAKAPEWKFEKFKGKETSSEKLRGKVYLLDFWGSWCLPCRKAMPTIEKLHQYYEDNADVVVIGVSARERNPNASEDYFQDQGYTYLHLPNGDNIADLFDIRSFPTLYIIDKKGAVIDAFIGFSKEGDFERVKSVIESNL